MQYSGRKKVIAGNLPVIAELNVLCTLMAVCMSCFELVWLTEGLLILGIMLCIVDASKNRKYTKKTVAFVKLRSDNKLFYYYPAGVENKEKVEEIDLNQVVGYGSFIKIIKKNKILHDTQIRKHGLKMKNGDFIEFTNPSKGKTKKEIDETIFQIIEKNTGKRREEINGDKFSFFEKVAYGILYSIFLVGACLVIAAFYICSTT
ncbi:hypothetical protein [Lachnobacterium bovis]|uniref:Uncharacterized protein n=1 Tax=Lachnobacterium bovis TaxID=140626 RepID=A0A1H9UA75_9FIRM|nr:hypothetical protein [Lachnobacterium bovis]SES06161.1 hypothetical protein SAMN02910429_02003 [Lachnobacterium bovis]